MAEFQDHFSGHASEYARYRPRYPDALFEWLAAQAPMHNLAWDVGTGSGQAALGLARHFARVIATDAAEAQLRNAVPHERVVYMTMPAERATFADKSIDLVTIAQAIHWFAFDRFYREVRRVLKPGGVIAAWTYGENSVTPEVDAVVQRYYSKTVGAYWPPERELVEARYQTIPFPFDELQAPPLRMREHWRLEDMLGYLGTWSATKRYAQAHGEDPIEQVREPLKRAWGTEEVRVVEWEFFVRAGRV
jgi:SAM-dependent methyltransferase